MTASNLAAESPDVLRHGDADSLSLALMRARNRSLQWLSAFEAASGLTPPAQRERFSPPAWVAGHAGWFQEYWIARHVQRSRGDAGDPAGPRLASIEPQADGWWHPAHSTAAARWTLDLPDGPTLRHWLAETMEVTLDLLAAAKGDDALHVFRGALHHEDCLGETFAELAQAMGLPPSCAGECWHPLPARPSRTSIGLPARRWMLGSPPGGFVPEAERWAHELSLPPFEIDAQPVSWAQFVEFVDDGGYDDRRWWSEPGWQWLQQQVAANGPRSPRYVEQMRRGVVMSELGRLTRLPPSQPARHVTAHEADAWCRWAGRRLPTEAEWELAACMATGRGFVWGDVWEWVAGSACLYPGHTGGVFAQPAPAPGARRVLRGASWLTAARLRHPKARRFVDPARDDTFCGFRSCAI